MVPYQRLSQYAVGYRVHYLKKKETAPPESQLKCKEITQWDTEYINQRAKKSIW